MQTFAHERYSGKLFSDGTTDSGFSPPLCFVKKPLTALRGNWPETAANHHYREKD
jgi:hypothetical protein